MTKDILRQTLEQSYTDCLDYDTLELRRREILDLNEKMYELKESELDTRTDEFFKTFKLDRLDLF